MLLLVVDWSPVGAADYSLVEKNLYTPVTSSDSIMLLEDITLEH